MKFSFIRENLTEFQVVNMCNVLGVSRAAYYAWSHRKTSPRAVRHKTLVRSIKTAHEASQKRYGAPRIHQVLRREGVPCGRHQVARLMRKNGIRGMYKRKFRITATRNEDHPIARNILARNFRPADRDLSWAADITYIYTAEGWLYLAVILDLYSRRVVGWAMLSYIDEQLALDALQIAVERRRPSPGLIHHSDRGCQYTSNAYRAALQAHGIIASMSRKGNCWDNSVAESFFHTLKTEAFTDVHFHTRKEARQEISSYIERFYNSSRLHSTLGFTSPVEYETVTAS